MYILGISSFYHDSAACLIRNDEVLSAVQEERFSRKKNDSAFPVQSIRYCLEHAEITLNEVSHVVYYEKPFLKFERLVESYLSTAPLGFFSFIRAIPLWVKEKIFQKKIIASELRRFDPSWKSNDKRLLFTSHHQSHAGSAFFPSPFQKAIVLCLDGVGEWATSSVWIGEGNQLSLKKQMLFPHSLGLLYSTITAYLGFKVNCDEYKVMGLAPYGTSNYFELMLRNIIDLKADGSFKLNMKYFNFISGKTMFSKEFIKLLGREPRLANQEITAFHMDVASSIQKLSELIVVRMVNALVEEHKIYNLCIAGGVALNCVINGKILSGSKIKSIWIQPAAGDSGGALGAAFCGYYQHLNHNRTVAPEAGDLMKRALLGPSYTSQQAEQVLSENKLSFTKPDGEEFLRQISLYIQSGKIIGWFTGRMEFGPRALGARSILGDPRNPKMQNHINLNVKFRESFRPFAPAILFDHLTSIYKLKHESPYMTIVADVNHPIPEPPGAQQGFDRLKNVHSSLPAVTHVDYSSRIQTVSEENGLFYNLIRNFHDLTGCPAVINTSFNLKDEPIVCSPQDAVNCFLKTNIDVLAIEGLIVVK